MEPVDGDRSGNGLPRDQGTSELLESKASVANKSARGKDEIDIEAQTRGEVIYQSRKGEARVIPIESEDGSEAAKQVSGNGNDFYEVTKLDHIREWFCCRLAPKGGDAKKPLKLDLDQEQLERLRMITGLTKSEICSVRMSFLRYSSNPETITSGEFLNIPCIRLNPLRQRLLYIFGLDVDQGGKSKINFREFMESISILNSPTVSVDQKLKVAFQLHDMDGDGKISLSDLVDYLKLTCHLPKNGNSFGLDDVAKSVLNECSSHPSREFINIGDFSKVALMVSDFDVRLRLSV